VCVLPLENTIPKEACHQKLHPRINSCHEKYSIFVFPVVDWILIEIFLEQVCKLFLLILSILLKSLYSQDKP
jgi:hypothetical protein